MPAHPAMTAHLDDDRVRHHDKGLLPGAGRKGNFELSALPDVTARRPRQASRRPRRRPMATLTRDTSRALNTIELFLRQAINITGLREDMLRHTSLALNNPRHQPRGRVLEVSGATGLDLSQDARSN